MQHKKLNFHHSCKPIRKKRFYNLKSEKEKGIRYNHFPIDNISILINSLSIFVFSIS
jgi:hypothetical protein